MVFDLSLARGLDYYTGLIYEAVLEGETCLGSIASGGRYDELIGMFSKDQIPAVGMSIGLERIFSLLENSKEEYKAAKSEVMVASVGDGLVTEKLKLVGELWRAGIPAELLYKAKAKPDEQLEYALSRKMKFVIFIGGDEIAKGVVKLKNMDEKSQVEVKREEVVEIIRSQLQKNK